MQIVWVVLHCKTPKIGEIFSGRVHRITLYHGKAVHEIRIRLKQLKAIVRLLNRISGVHLKRQLTQSKKTSDSLAAVRDAAVLRKLWSSFAHDRKIKPIINKLNIDLNMAFEESFHIKNLDNASTALRGMRDIGRTIENLGLNRRRVKQALKKSIRAWRRSRRACVKNSAPSRFHRWRRRTKDLQYQLEALAPVLKTKSKVTIPALKKTAKLTGAAHDLVLLEAILLENNVKESKAGKKLLAVIRKKSRQFNQEALCCIPAYTQKEYQKK